MKIQNYRSFAVGKDEDYKEDLEGEEKVKQEKKEPHRKFNKPYEKPEFLQDDYDHLQKGPSSATIENTGFDIGDDEFLPDYMQVDAPTYKRNTANINLPWLINGAPQIEIQTRFMGE